MTATSPLSDAYTSAPDGRAFGFGNDILKDCLLSDLVATHGELVGGVSLYRLLGFRSAASFRDSHRRGRTPIPVFQIPGRRGHFALTRDVATWLHQHRAKALQREKSVMP